MATISPKVEYPTSDGKPMAETDAHRAAMIDLIQTLECRYADDPMAYVSGNLLLFYEEGNRRCHLSPDVFIVKGVRKYPRLNYRVWEEGKGPDLVIELTSKSTRNDDLTTKRELYRSVLGVSEYYLFDPIGDAVTPSLQGYRRMDGDYRPIEPRDGRLPSEVTGLHLEARGDQLRLFDPATGQILLTPQERAVEAESGLAAAEAELDRLRREIEAMKRAGGG